MKKDYNGNVNPIRDVMTPTKENKQENVTMPKSEMNNKNNMSNGKITPKTIAKKRCKCWIKRNKSIFECRCKNG